MKAITVNGNEYKLEFGFDAAENKDIVQKMENSFISANRMIKENDEYDNVFPIQEAKESWSNDGELKVEVQRSRNKI